MRIVIFASSREAEMEEPVFCDKDSVRVDSSKCSGKTLTIASPLSRYLKDLGFNVTVIDPFAEDGDYDADQIIKGTVFTIPDELIKDSYVIVATKHVYDTWAIMKSIQAKAKSISVVMSLKRAKIILKRLIEAGISKDELKALRIPAGLDIGAKTDKEIALSIVAEILSVDRNTTGMPLREIKGFEKMVDEL
ncbi:XdhC family protein [Acidianus manzaensis]|uniref:Xanthine dehydrogenase n=1 Tax=Acidianus manzaensis TaxID=282676 RepID=A0A1W6K0N4_9CREN|nr:XdhC family protein [Acidianus manzaensis]ARM76069.1 xanthine dehydrogenase [Acidianus manzaensis]